MFYNGGANRWQKPLWWWTRTPEFTQKGASAWKKLNSADFLSIRSTRKTECLSRQNFVASSARNSSSALRPAEPTVSSSIRSRSGTDTLRISAFSARVRPAPMPSVSRAARRDAALADCTSLRAAEPRWVLLYDLICSYYPLLRSACSHSSCKLPMLGVEGVSPRVLLGVPKGEVLF